MNRYTLPIDVTLVESLTAEDSYVDMSSLDFPCAPEHQKRSAFLFLRNTNLRIPLKFETCSFKDRSEWMLLYYQGSIGVKIPELDTAWIKMLLHRAHFQTPAGLFTPDEMDGFIQANQKFVNEVLRLIISLPLCSMDVFSKGSEGSINMSEFPHTDWGELNFNNFLNLLDYDALMSLIRPIDGLHPTYYDRYFNTEGNPYIGIIMQKMPYLNLLNGMFYNPKGFTETLQSMMK